MLAIASVVWARRPWLGANAAGAVATAAGPTGAAWWIGAQQPDAPTTGSATVGLNGTTAINRPAGAMLSLRQPGLMPTRPGQ
ncbi:hypothetical protein [Catellatospora chokoriensis]|uniref:Uncharacterized protein n=1 Tax=Catellatospora chokoriensis TaxID=310353 RepID=A0A8J3NU97_9ACTN|nr:hypothetical protein [Catellatospora chokoriensis]GIF92516.1 hypothetical protein Cch02nite_59600 [Catellatospora chokoriensis]